MGTHWRMKLVKTIPLQLTLLGIPLLCMIILWNINIHRIWYDHAPWEKLEPPPSRIVKILRVEFPYRSYHRGFISSSLRSPAMVVYAENQKIYAVDGKGQWRSLAYPENMQYYPLTSNSRTAYEISCTARLQYLWGLEAEQDDRAALIDARGSCINSLYNSDQYVVYKILKTGEVWQKYVDGYDPERLRGQINSILWLFWILSAPVWLGMFIHIDPVKLKPDFEAK